MSENEVSVFNPVSLMPFTFEGKFEMAQLLVRSRLLPSGLDTPEKVCVALEWGHELQLSPMVAVNNIAVINGKPTLSADIMAAVVKRSPEYGGVEWVKSTDTEAECIVTRKGANYEEKTRSCFTITDAKAAGLTNKDVWRKYPKRMLKHRCLSYALRDAFPDILTGLLNPEEAESIAPEQSDTERNVTPSEQGNVEKVLVGVESGKCHDDGEAQNAGPSVNYIALESLLESFGVELSGRPYSMAKAVLDNPSATEEEVSAMYDRCVKYLGRKGIQVT